jgi:hypothetical protein
MRGFTMIATFTRTFYRRDTNVPFPAEPEGLAEHISIKYSDKCIKWRDPYVSEDGLVKITTSTWVNLEELLLAKKDPLLVENGKTSAKHCEDNGIIMYTSIL